MVKRHLLTLFVLLSGLAALQAPAHGASAQTVAAQAGAIVGGYEAPEAPHELCAFVAQARAQARSIATGRAVDAQCGHYQVDLPTLAAPYVFGVERALE